MDHTTISLFRYANAFRVVPAFELKRIFEFAPTYAQHVDGFSAGDQVQFTMGKLPRRASTSRLVRNAAVRFKMLGEYGTTCTFTGNDMMSLDGLRSAVEVGHVRPLKFYGRDHIQNVLPMSSLANWAWDEGLVPIGRRAELLARGLPEGTRALFAKCREIRFPKDLRVWPLEENFEFHRVNIFERSLKEREQTLLELRRLHGDSPL
ncbi:hypothetical protein DMC47_09915 [Nostoc sp. 3335mG]|nr:hypothetical protein DMC47_09915 [Nostoc sp. 3335mG]